VKIEGLDKLQKELAEFGKAVSSLDGTICELRFNPEDQGSVREAISQMERAVDTKVARWRNNKTIMDLAKEMKARFRQQIMNRTRKG
jgi:hypothetical protein